MREFTASGIFASELRQIVMQQIACGEGRFQWKQRRRRCSWGNNDAAAAAGAPGAGGNIAPVLGTSSPIVAVCPTQVVAALVRIAAEGPAPLVVDWRCRSFRSTLLSI